MAVAIVLSTLIASIAYLIPRLLTLKINLNQMRIAGEAMALQFEDDDTVTSASGSGEGPYGHYA